MPTAPRLPKPESIVPCGRHPEALEREHHAPLPPERSVQMASRRTVRTRRCGSKCHKGQDARQGSAAGRVCLAPGPTKQSPVRAAPS